MNITIRSADIQELEDILVLNQNIFGKNILYDNDLKEDFSMSEEGKSFFKESLLRSDGCFFVAESEHQLIGYVNGGHKIIPYRKSKYFEIDNIGVIPEFKGKGIANMLLQKTMEWAQEHGYAKIYINCYAKNTEALHFYNKHNFSIIDICLEKNIS